MVLRRVRAEEKDRARLLDIVKRIGRSAGAERQLHAGRRRRMTYPSAAIDVVGSNDNACEFLGQVVFLVRSAGRSENSDAVGTKFGGDLPQPIGHEPDCFIPRCGLPISVTANHRRRDAIRSVNKVQPVAPLRAQMTSVDDTFHRRPSGNQSSVSDPDVQLAARATVGANRANLVLRRTLGKCLLISQRAGGASINTSAATHAVAIQQTGSTGGANFRGCSAIPGAPHILPGDLFANPHAAEAGNALRHVHMNAWMGIVDAFWACAAEQLTFEPVFPNQAVERCRRIALDRRCGIFLDEQAQKCSSKFIDFGGMRANRHAVGHRRRASGNRTRLPRDIDDTKSAGPDRRQAWVVAQRRQFNSLAAHCGEDRHAGCTLHGLLINGHLKHEFSSRA